MFLKRKYSFCSAGKLAYVKYDKCESVEFFFCLIMLELNVRERGLAGRPEKGFGWRAEHEENGEKRLRRGRRFSYNSRKLCRSLEARPWVT